MVNFKEAKPKFTPVMPKIIIYGRNGIGKSRFAMFAPNPIFLDLDKNLAQYKVVTNESEGIHCPLETFQQVLDFLSLLINEPHDFKTVVIDSISSLDVLIENQIKKERNVASLTDLQYGKGYEYAKVLWHQIRDKLQFLWEKRKMMIILTGHDQIRERKHPVHGNYNWNALSLNDKCADIFRHWASTIFYVTDQLKFKDEVGGFGKINKKISDARKVLYTSGESLFIAKNTYNLPEVIPFDNAEEAWNTFYTAINNFYIPTKPTAQTTPQTKGEN